MEKKSYFEVASNWIENLIEICPHVSTEEHYMTDKHYFLASIRTYSQETTSIIDPLVRVRA